MQYDGVSPDQYIPYAMIIKGGKKVTKIAVENIAH
jgi:hypothetical protein